MVYTIDGAHLAHRRARQLDERMLLVQEKRVEVTAFAERLGADCLRHRRRRLHRVASEHIVIRAKDRLGEAI
eukprot:1928079-Prymnesium_polylepis.1